LATPATGSGSFGLGVRQTCPEADTACRRRNLLQVGGSDVLSRWRLSSTLGLLFLGVATTAVAEGLPATMDRYDCEGLYTESVLRPGEVRTHRFRFGLLWNIETRSMTFIGSVPVLDGASLIPSGQFATSLSQDGVVGFRTGALGPEGTRGDFVFDPRGGTLRLMMTYARGVRSPAPNELRLDGLCVQNRTYDNLKPL
jgi:hypothetical protein